MTSMKKLLTCMTISLCFIYPLYAKNSFKSKKLEPPSCAQNVIEKAKQLFVLHYGAEESLANGGASFSKVVEMPPVKSPDGKRMYKNFETIAKIGKMGLYRIRMIYAQLGDKDSKIDCVLMGQEILDLSSL